MRGVTTLVRAKPDSAAVAAVDVARAALLDEVGSADVGEHLGHVVEGERLVTHLFACERAGYRGWRWSVTVTRAPRQKHITVDEVVLVPGEDAIVAPPWVPYRERIQPGDLGPGDLLPVEDDDPRLVPTYSYGDDPLDADDRAQVRQVAQDLGLGRVRTLSPEGRDAAAQRWYDGDQGPSSPLAQAAPDSCTTCGFLLRINGPLSEMFGVCANGDANDDGKVVSFDHGCGAHSEVRLAKKHEPLPLPEPVIDTITLEDLERF
ncbi:DUF3027 domain-containing protein [Nocardioides sp. zg-579]|uniref:DUF3027 domain-containing protein n=1 Tax=Nocardioides marmotae TaxID=2663857 RepID=A0A6I3JCX1_9ACTN|nr:DUF3027 domain-containing protein [Gordonia jinghuaiqii]MTB95987.1 DUF3027 domain-containing protein [Nocardioides marmotae]QKE03637.1 DUF3027 domain-containing protein [Nocardioides marmotae]